jgi:two-component system nitrogen regulation response regulator GlnG
MEKPVLTNDTDKLLSIVEVKIEDIAEGILTANINGNDNILPHLQRAIEKIFIHAAMRKTGDNISKAAKLLGMNRNTLSKKLKLLKGE